MTDELLRQADENLRMVARILDAIDTTRDPAVAVAAAQVHATQAAVSVLAQIALHLETIGHRLDRYWPSP